LFALRDTVFTAAMALMSNSASSVRLEGINALAHSGSPLNPAVPFLIQRLDDPDPETAKAAALLGLAGHFHLGYDDGELPDDRELRGAIVRIVRELKPEVVLCPDPTAVFFGDGYFNHHDHRVTGWATLDAIAPSAGNPHYFPEHLRDGLEVHQVRAVYLSGTLEPNWWVDIADTLERKIDGLFCHASRLVAADDWFRQFLRDRAEQGGAEAGMRYAEPFRRITLSS
jgi:LmbE family N-acetylglucosaminyl deacetylase